MELKPQDLLVLFKQVAQPAQVWTYATLGEAVLISASHAHRRGRRAVSLSKGPSHSIK